MDGMLKQRKQEMRAECQVDEVALAGVADRLAAFFVPFVQSLSDAERGHEQCLQFAKAQGGLADDEVRTWPGPLPGVPRRGSKRVLRTLLPLRSGEIRSRDLD